MNTESVLHAGKVESPQEEIARLIADLENMNGTSPVPDAVLARIAELEMQVREVGGVGVRPGRGHGNDKGPVRALVPSRGSVAGTSPLLRVSEGVSSPYEREVIDGGVLVAETIPEGGELAAYGNVQGGVAASPDRAVKRPVRNERGRTVRVSNEDRVAFLKAWADVSSAEQALVANGEQVDPARGVIFNNTLRRLKETLQGLAKEVGIDI